MEREAESKSKIVMEEKEDLCELQAENVILREILHKYFVRYGPWDGPNGRAHCRFCGKSYNDVEREEGHYKDCLWNQTRIKLFKG